ncbi:hypothetical protein DAEQUDRAFT_83462 [Daedalea quercina L-15889]|uniref:Uncharacterized protein n=1 Tax=Daedalea quercina L-15889 TaxID=1314783 RepID=A0A165SI44_9APHY|nr:hypothetical protein DAEQUDRAFT_83462 [Daedalea quercina L-15889]
MSEAGQFSHPEVPALTVHSLVLRASQPESSQDLLRSGQALVGLATKSDGWCSPDSHRFRRIFVFQGRCYEYRQSPPLYEQHTAKQRHNYKEWGSAIDVNDGDEICSLRDLDEFECSDFSKDPFAKVQCGTSHKRKTIEFAECRSPEKRPRLSSDFLYRAIPQPHFIPIPDETPSIGFTHTGLEKYLSRNPPLPALPHTLNSIRESLDDTYARSAWIIPVRGSPPWHGCTAASVLDPERVLGSISLEKLSPRPPQTGTPGEPLDTQIVWTFDALATFWAFLLKLREGGALGPISLSFHAAPALYPESLVSNTTAVHAGHAVESVSHGLGVSERTSTSFTTRRVRSSLLAMDHIKIYHGVRHSMQLRHVLYAWSYEMRNTEVAEAAREGMLLTKVRLFKGARLVLVDERSKAILTM